jgi:predicted metal-dependent hydrolase
MEVEVIRSARRRKTVEARLVDGVLEVRVPARMSRRDEEQSVREMVDRFERKRRASLVDVEARARSLARRHDLPQPTGVRWVENQRTRWGSCTPETGEIRVSAVLAGYPRWVLDYVLVHELAHLVEPNHSARFHELVHRYPKAERAEGFLIAKGLGEDDADDQLLGLTADDQADGLTVDDPAVERGADEAPLATARPVAPVDEPAPAQPSLF